MNIYSIYKAVNKVNGRCYIGYDQKWPLRRKNHVTRSFNKKTRDYWYQFHIAIREFGEELFGWEILYTTPSLDVAKYMEKYFIQKYNSYYKWENGGYNMTLGGDGAHGLKHTPEHIEKRVSKYRNKKRSVPVWNKGLKFEYLPRYGIKGKKQTEESIRKRVNAVEKVYLLCNDKGQDFLVKGIKNIDSYGIPHRTAEYTLMKNRSIKFGPYKGWQLFRI